MKMLRQMYDYTKQDPIRNNVIQKKINVAPIVKKMT